MEAKHSSRLQLQQLKQPRLWNRPFSSSHSTKSRSRLHVRASSAAAQWIENNLGTGKVVKETFNGGSQWASSYFYQTSAGAKYFVKTALGRDDSMFKGEALGLQAMYDTHSIRVPKVFHYGLLHGPGRAGSFIVMECLDMNSSLSQEELGRRLAQMHLATPKDEMAQKGYFGFPVDNTIGGTPQPNAWMDNWVEFFRERRLQHQLKLAGDTNLSRLSEKLLDNLEVLFEGVEVKPAVLHGDLWSGNIGAVHGQPVIFDPATFYGHSEHEFGMSWCAGFSQAFYKAYHELIPKAPGFDERRDLYLLYHYLNHYNLFGESYYNQCVSCLQRLNKAIAK